jgi:flagellar biosynthetic protein FliQ
MNEATIQLLATRAMYMAVILALPLLVACLAIGIVVSIFQAVTQIHEQSLSFVPKVIAVLALLAIIGSWMVGQLESFTREIFNALSQI